MAALPSEWARVRLASVSSFSIPPPSLLLLLLLVPRFFFVLLLLLPLSCRVYAITHEMYTN